MAKFHEVKHNVVSLDMDEKNGLLLTVGKYRDLCDIFSLQNYSGIHGTKFFIF